MEHLAPVTRQMFCRGRTGSRYHLNGKGFPFLHQRAQNLECLCPSIAQPCLFKRDPAEVCAWRRVEGGGGRSVTAFPVSDAAGMLDGAAEKSLSMTSKRRIFYACVRFHQLFGPDDGRLPLPQKMDKKICHLSLFFCCFFPF